MAASFSSRTGLIESGNVTLGSTACRNQYVFKTRQLVSASSLTIPASSSSFFLDACECPQLWEEHAFDAVICPTQATPALKHGETKENGALIMRE